MGGVSRPQRVWALGRMDLLVGRSTEKGPDWIGKRGWCQIQLIT